MFMTKNAVKKIGTAIATAILEKLSVDNNEESVLSLDERRKKLEAHIIKLEKEIKGTNDKHITEKLKLEQEIENIKSAKEVEDLNLKHLVKMKEEKNEIALEKAKLKIKAEYKDKELELLKANHTASMKLLDDGKKDLQDIYKNILAKLPQVNYDISEEREKKIG